MEDHWSISRQLSNQESCRRIRFFDDGNYIDTVRMSFIFFFFGGKFEERNERIQEGKNEQSRRIRPKEGVGNRI